MIKFKEFVKRLRTTNLKLNLDKYEVLEKEIAYFKHIIGETELNQT